MPLAGFEHAIPKSERPQTYALDRAATCNSNYCDTSANEDNLFRNHIH